MTVPSTPPGSTEPLPDGQPSARRPGFLLGVGMGALLPALTFALSFVTQNSWETSLLYSLVSGVWSVLAFAGVFLIAFERTRGLGLGILLGFCGLLLVGGGVCTAVFVVVAP